MANRKTTKSIQTKARNPVKSRSTSSQPKETENVQTEGKSKTLQEVTLEWKSLERKTEKQRKEAEAYYADNVMELVVNEFVNNNNSKVHEKVNYLIMSVGTFYEPLVLNISVGRLIRMHMSGLWNYKLYAIMVEFHCMKFGHLLYYKNKVMFEYFEQNMFKLLTARFCSFFATFSPMFKKHMQKSAFKPYKIAGCWGIG